LFGFLFFLWFIFFIPHSFFWDLLLGLHIFLPLCRATDALAGRHFLTGPRKKPLAAFSSLLQGYPTLPHLSALSFVFPPCSL
jgi:hypothetical protein